MPDWDQEVRPVLEAVHTAIQRDSAAGAAGDFSTTGQTVNEVMRRDPGDERTGAILTLLHETGYVHGEFVMQSSLPIILRMREKGYKVVAGWPDRPGEDTQRQVLARLDELIAHADSPDERNRLEKVRDGFRELGREVVVEIIAGAATGRIQT